MAWQKLFSCWVYISETRAFKVRGGYPPAHVPPSPLPCRVCKPFLMTQGKGGGRGGAGPSLSPKTRQGTFVTMKENAIIRATARQLQCQMVPPCASYSVIGNVFATAPRCLVESRNCRKRRPTKGHGKQSTGMSQEKSRSAAVACSGS